MRQIWMAQLDKVRPVVVLTRDSMFDKMTKVTVAPITHTAKGLTTEVRVGRANGLDDDDSVVSCDNIVTVPRDLLQYRIGWLGSVQDEELAEAMVAAFDLDV